MRQGLILLTNKCLLLYSVKQENPSPIMKKVFLIAIVAGVTLSSCAKRYTCPTYSKANTSAEQTYASVKTIEKGM